jgi:hypothetical protein
MIGVPSWLKEVIQVAEVLGLPVARVIDGWARSQPATDNFYRQFVAGIRYIDLRIVYDENTHLWRTHHSMLEFGLRGV